MFTLGFFKNRVGVLMKIRSLIVSFLFIFTFVTTADASPSAPKVLTAQVQNVIKLLSDGDAVSYPQATMVQRIKRGKHDEVDLVVFSIEGFGGGNNYNQYLAVFIKNTTTHRKQHYTLIDVMHIGGGSWRKIQKLNAKTTGNLIDVANLGQYHWGDEELSTLKDQTMVDNIKNGSTILIDALENSGMDCPNFPSKETTIKLVLKGGRLYEQEAQ